MPSISVAIPMLYLWVFMINIENTNIIITTPYTLTAEFIYYCLFALPVPVLLAQVIIVFIPIFALALYGAIGCVGWLTANLTDTIRFPPIFKIAFSGAIFGFISSIWENIKCLTTVFTAKCNHKYIILHTLGECKMYFAIAERRIKEAQMQPRLL